MKALDQWLGANPGASVAEIREAAIGLTCDILGVYGDAASSLACELFDSVMEAEGVAVPSAQVYDGYREAAVEGTVRRTVGDVDGSQESLDAFKKSVGQLAENETRRAASSTIEQNVERTSKTKAGRNVRYARVPMKGIPCEWCAMLASRGFVYRSSERAEAASHHHCSCTIVPGVQGKTQVADYDPDHYYDVWKNREKYEIQEQVEKTITEIQRGIKQFEAEQTEESYENNVRSLIRSLSSGAPIDARYGAKPKPKELRTAVSLSKSGRSVVFLREVDEDNIKNIDCLLDGRLYEMKAPDPPKQRAAGNDPLRFVENNLKKAKKQFEEKHYDETGDSIVQGGPIRVVFDIRGREASEKAVKNRLSIKKAERHIDDILFVGYSGGVEPIE